jgi:hypothetical protein
MSVVAVLSSAANTVAELVVRAADQTPKDEDVKAGWLAFAIFIGLILAVAFLGFSLVKQLRKAQAAKEAGVYGDEPESSDDAEAEPENHTAS